MHFSNVKCYEMLFFKFFVNIVNAYYMCFTRTVAAVSEMYLCKS